MKVSPWSDDILPRCKRPLNRSSKVTNSQIREFFPDYPKLKQALNETFSGQDNSSPFVFPGGGLFHALAKQVCKK